MNFVPGNMLDTAKRLSYCNPVVSGKSICMDPQGLPAGVIGKNSIRPGACNILTPSFAEFASLSRVADFKGGQRCPESRVVDEPQSSFRTLRRRPMLRLQHSYSFLTWHRAIVRSSSEPHSKYLHRWVTSEDLARQRLR